MDEATESIAHARPQLSFEEAQRDVALLRLVLWYVSAVVSKHQLWAAQGNTTKDGRAWAERVAQSTVEITDKGGVAGEDLATVIGVPNAHVKKLAQRAAQMLADLKEEFRNLSKDVTD
eukprot:SAG31_NODE_10008_length_1197_cov_0.984517_2_plen_118_part_00